MIKKSYSSPLDLLKKVEKSSKFQHFTGISFPAIYWWRTSSPNLYLDQSKCLFTDDAYYVVFSSLISFYIPLGLILFAYGRVYCIATTHSKSLKSGEKRVSTFDSLHQQLSAIIEPNNMKIQPLAIKLWPKQ